MSLAGHLEEVIAAALPATSPLGGVKVTAVGSVAVNNAQGGPVLAMDVNILAQ
jgi:hypothetical protein